MHRHEMNGRFILYQSLSSVSVMNIPVNDEQALGSVRLSRVSCGQCDIPEEAKSHGAVTECVMTRWTHCTERSHIESRHRPVHCVEDASSAGCRGGPRSLTDYGIVVEGAPAFRCESLDHRHVSRVVSERQLIVRRVPSLEMFHVVEEARLVPQGSRYRAQSADVLGVRPTRVVPAAVRMRYEADARASAVRAYLTGLRLRLVRSRVEPSFTPDASIVSSSRRISKPRSFATNSSATKPLG